MDEQHQKELSVVIFSFSLLSAFQPYNSNNNSQNKHHRVCGMDEWLQKEKCNAIKIKKQHEEHWNWIIHSSPAAITAPCTHKHLACLITFSHDT
jgi:hypothetical protein